LVTTVGSITINDGDANSTGVSANGSGNVLLQSQGGAGQNVNLNTTVKSGTGNISVLGSDSVNQAATGSPQAGNITTGGNGGAAGTVDVEAGLGSITMGAGSVTQTGGGNIRYNAAVNVSVSVIDGRTAADRSGPALTSQATAWGSASIIAGGSITNSNANGTV